MQQGMATPFDRVKERHRDVRGRGSALTGGVCQYPPRMLPPHRAHTHSHTHICFSSFYNRTSQIDLELCRHIIKLVPSPGAPMSPPDKAKARPTRTPTPLQRRYKLRLWTNYSGPLDKLNPLVWLSEAAGRAQYHPDLILTNNVSCLRCSTLYQSRTRLTGLKYHFSYDFSEASKL